VLYGDHVKALRKMPGVWPPEFDEEEEEAAGPQAEAEAGDDARHGSEGSGSEGSDGGLAPLQPNTNRKVVYHEVSSSSSEEDD
jgi:hypothetical protein